MSNFTVGQILNIKYVIWPVVQFGSGPFAIEAMIHMEIWFIYQKKC